MEIGWLTNPIDFFPHLYHYSTAEKTIEYILGEGTLKFSHITKTNDPLEYHDLNFSVITNKDEIARQAIEFAKKTNNLIIKNTKIACFSIDSIPCRNPDGSYCENTFYKAYSRSRMWSQYANNHKGCCLVFNQSKLLDNVKKNINIEYYEVQAGEIEYTNNTNDYEEMMSIKTHVVDDHEYYQKKLLSWKKLLFRKLTDYKDEQEYRIALIPQNLDSNDFDDIYINFNDSLETIILGDRFPKPYEVNIIEYAKKHEMNIYKVSWGSGKPEISYKFRYKDLDLTTAST